MRQPIEVHVVLNPDGTIGLDGPTESPVLMIGILEQAKLLYAQSLGATKNEAEEKSRILVGSAALGAALAARGKTKP